MLGADGSLDRAALGRIVFADRTARAELEAIIHPEVYRRIREWFANLPAGTRFAIADIPLLFETGHEHDFDAIVVCACDPDEQVRRSSRATACRPRPPRPPRAQWPIRRRSRAPTT